MAKRSSKKTKTEEYITLLKNLENTKYEISGLDDALNYVTDPILLNQIIFQRKAAQMRYRYWYKLMREMKISSQVKE